MKIHAKIKEFKYPILIGNELLKVLPKEISKFTNSKKILILMDKNLSKKYRAQVKKILDKNRFESFFFIVTAGKKCKDIKNLTRIVDTLEKKKFSKDSTLIVFGGGTIGDLGGFAASVFYRGLNLVSIPTTLTAQIDSSVGGKVAINFNNNINAMGNYYHPKLIICDYIFIRTLPKREFVSGMAEVIKSVLIADKNKAKFIKENSRKIMNYDKKTIIKMIVMIIKIKLSLVSRDEREKNVRMFLNYGHTIGQAIESSSNLKLEYYRHGEAVALGMLCVAFIAEKYFKIPNLCKIHYDLFKRYNLPVNIERLSKSKKEILSIIFRNISKDKKKNYKGIRFILLKDIGNPKVISTLKPDLIKESIYRLIK
jgi:3-dehydroquinate synthase